MPDRMIERDIVERPESVLVLPGSQKGMVLLIEEYDLGTEAWQLTIPDGQVIGLTPEGICKQAELELREETGYCLGRLEKLLDFIVTLAILVTRYICLWCMIWSGNR